MEKRTAFITGVSRGLGYGFAEHLAKNGWHVYGCSRNRPEALYDLYGGRFKFLPLDVADAEAGPILLRQFIREAGNFDLVILNAGVLGEIADMRDTELNDLKRIMEINLWSNKWILDTLLEGGRHLDQVIGISSGASVSGNRGWNGYSLSKAALNMMIKLYAGEVPGTHFTALAPGLIDTEMQVYLSSIPDDDRFDTVRRLKQARGTEAMPHPAKAAPHILAQLQRLREYASGSFVDIRKM